MVRVSLAAGCAMPDCQVQSRLPIPIPHVKMEVSDRMGRSTGHVTIVTLAEEIAARIRQSILTGSLHPGKKLCPHEIAEQFGVHTPPVADALGRLEAQGLVVATPGHSGSHVGPLDSTDLRGIYQLRRLVEPELAAQSCLLLSEPELDGLEALTATLDNHRVGRVGGGRGGDNACGRDEVHRTHHEFHRRLLAAATRCELLVLEPAWRAAQRYMWLAYHHRRYRLHVERHPRPLSHRELVAGFRSRDPATVEAAIRRHLEGCEEIARRALAWAIAQPAGS